MQIPSSKLIRHTDTYFASQICVIWKDDALEKLLEVAVVTEVGGGTQEDHI